jgi:hypothetical protein
VEAQAHSHAKLLLERAATRGANLPARGLVDLALTAIPPLLGLAKKNALSTETMGEVEVHMLDLVDLIGSKVEELVKTVCEEGAAATAAEATLSLIMGEWSGANSSELSSAGVLRDIVDLVVRFVPSGADADELMAAHAGFHLVRTAVFRKFERNESKE